MRGCPGSSCPPPQLLGLGENRGQAPHGYSRVPPVAPAVPASHPSPGRDREELSASCPRHRGPDPSPALPTLLTLAPFSPGLPAGPGFPTSPYGTEEVRGQRDGRWPEGTRRGGAYPVALLPRQPRQAIEAPVTLRGARGRMSPRPRPPQQRGRGRPGTPSTLGPVSPGRPLAPSAPARPCKRKRRGKEGAKGSVPPGARGSRWHLWLRVTAGQDVLGGGLKSKPTALTRLPSFPGGPGGPCSPRGP